MLSNLLIKIIVLFLPTQLGLHFWPAFSRVAGVKIDYLSPTLYFLDLLLVLLVLLNLKRIASCLKNNFVLVCVFLSLIAINIVFSVSPLNTLFWWIRVILYLLVFLTLRLRKVKWEDLRTPLIISTVSVVILEIIQLLLQSSLGGALYYLGERSYSLSTPGIGRINLLGLEILRPISTFSHANSLAGYLLIVFYLFTKKPVPFWYRLVPFLGILISFSKTSIIAMAFIIFNIRPEITICVSIILTVTQLVFQSYSISNQSISDRLFFLPYLKKILFRNVFTGVGLGNFIPSLGLLLPGSFLTPVKLQPIHNLPYLYLSELGLSGVILLIYISIKKKISTVLANPLVFGLLALVLFTGTFDHYSWTLPQNKLIVLIALSIMF